MKKVFFTLVLLSAILGGLFSVFEDKIFIDIPDDVISNLNRRYNEKDFKFKRYINEENSENSRVMIIDGKYGDFKLTRYYDDKNNIRYNDNYLGYKYKSELYDDMYSCFKRVDDRFNFELDLNNSDFPNETDTSFLLDKLLEDDKTFLKVKVVTIPNWTDDDIEIFALKLSEFKIKANVSMLCYDRLINMSDFDSVMKSDNSVGKKVFFSVGSNGEVLYINRE